MRWETIEGWDWERWRHAFGPACEVPTWLREIASFDAEARARGYAALYSTIWHQGTVYEASAPAARALVELLKEPAVPERQEILLLLQHLATGDSYLNVHGPGPIFDSFRDSPDFARRLEAERAAVRETYAAVVEGCPVYLELLQRGELAVRVVAPFLLATCVDRSHEAEGGLLTRLDAEAEPLVRASIIEGLCRLWWRRARLRGASLSEQAPNLTSYLLPSMTDAAEAPIVKVIAAMNIMAFGEPALRQEALATCFDHAREAAADFERLPWSNGESLVHAVRAVLEEEPELAFDWYKVCLDDPEMTREALWGLAELGMEWRALAPRVAGPLAAAIASDSEDLRERASRDITRIGAAALAELEPLVLDPRPEVQGAARRALADIRRYRAEAQSIRESSWGAPAEPRPLTELIAALEAPNTGPGSTWTRTGALRSLAEAKLAEAKLDELDSATSQRLEAALNACLSAADSWTRISAAWVLWSWDRRLDDALATAIQEARGRPSGFLALALLEAMGPAARGAERHLQALLGSPRRVMEFGEFYRTAHLDEAFQEACIRALSAIHRSASAPARSLVSGSRRARRGARAQPQ